MTNIIKTRLIEPATTVVEIAGRLNLGNSLSYVETAIKKLIADGSRKIVVDIAGLTFIDSAGVGMLISCAGDMDQAGGVFRIAGATGPVAKVFDVVHMNRIADLDPDVETACRRLSGE